MWGDFGLTVTVMNKSDFPFLHNQHSILVVVVHIMWASSKCGC